MPRELFSFVIQQFSFQPTLSSNLICLSRSDLCYFLFIRRIRIALIYELAPAFGILQLLCLVIMIDIFWDLFARPAFGFRYKSNCFVFCSLDSMITRHAIHISFMSYARRYLIWHSQRLFLMIYGFTILMILYSAAATSATPYLLDDELIIPFWYTPFRFSCLSASTARFIKPSPQHHHR